MQIHAHAYKLLYIHIVTCYIGLMYICKNNISCPPNILICLEQVILYQNMNLRKLQK